MEYIRPHPKCAPPSGAHWPLYFLAEIPAALLRGFLFAGTMPQGWVNHYGDSEQYYCTDNIEGLHIFMILIIDFNFLGDYQSADP